MRKIIGTASAILLIAGCHGHDTAPQRTAKTADPHTDIDREAALHRAAVRPIEKAMGEIPPKLRVPFQAAMACEVRHRAKGSPAIIVTPDYVRSLTTRLERDSSLARC